MTLRPATLKDYEELVSMYKDLVYTVYHGMKVNDDIFLYGTVLEWFKKKRDIIVCETKDGDIAGFSLSFIEDIAIVEPYYMGDIAYVKPEYRKTRCAYLLYNNVVDYGKRIGLKVRAKAYVGNGNIDKVDKLQARFGTQQFTEFMTEN